MEQRSRTHTRLRDASRGILAMVSLSTAVLAVGAVIAAVLAWVFA
jgi:hypothetical protein